MSATKLISSIILLVLVDQGACIKCWECSSQYDRSCGNPFDNSTMSLTDCDLRYPTGERSTSCVKILQRFKGADGLVLVQRACAFKNNSASGGPCNQDHQDNVSIDHCSLCSYDACNGADTNIPSTIKILISSILLWGILNIIL